MDPDTDSPSQPSTPRALLITELLEKIILHLGVLPTLATATRVCRYWKNLIETSLSIRKMLMVMPKFHVAHAAESPEPNHREANHHGPRFYTETITYNPLLEKLPSPWKFSDRNLYKCQTRLMDNISLRRIAQLERIHAEREIPESWREMFISDPPCTFIQVSIYTITVVRDGQNVEEVPWASWIEIDDEHGIRCGLLEDGIQATVARHDNYWSDSSDEILKRRASIYFDCKKI